VSIADAGGSSILQNNYNSKPYAYVSLFKAVKPNMCLATYKIKRFSDNGVLGQVRLGLLGLGLFWPNKMLVLA
jgi:hypothetical protein